VNWWRRFRKSGELERQLDAELEDHIARDVAQKVREGLAEDEARRLARLALGGVAQVKEACRDARGTLWIGALAQDVRLALRMLRKSPGFAAAALATLALGIGANTAIFSVVYATLLKPLPYAEPGQLVSVSAFIPQLRSRFPSMPLPAPVFVWFRRSVSLFSGMSALYPAGFNLTGAGEPERLSGARVSANFFSLLGIQAERGRTFAPEEDEPGRDRVVVISHGLWVRRFGADPGILSRTLSLDGQSHAIIGVMPAALLFPANRQLHSLVAFGPHTDIWKPIAFTEDELQNWSNWNRAVIARLKPGATPAQARQEMDALVDAYLRQAGPVLDPDSVPRTLVVPLHEVFAGQARQGLLMLLGAVGLLLGIACVNLANLLLARMSARSREFAVRAALGAPRGRLVRQLLTESLVIAAMGAAAGVLIAHWGTRLLVSIAPSSSPAMSSARLDVPALLFTMAVAIVAAVGFGLAPAIDAARRNLHGNLAARGAAHGVRAGRLRYVLVTAEVALCTGLLAAAGLLLHSFVNVMSVEKGFAVEKILATELALPEREFSEPRMVAFYRDLAERVRALPGVISAGAVSICPLTAEWENSPVFLETDTGGRLDRPTVLHHSVTGDYFAAMGIPLLAGRAIEDREPAAVAVVSAGLARRLWPGEPLARAVGRRVKLGALNAPPATVVGVSGDVREEALERAPETAVYRPLSQAPRGEMTLVVRAAQEPEALAAAIRAEVWKLDKNLPISSMRTMREIVSASVVERRFQMTLIVLFAVLSLALAVVGIYGVVGYSVAQRTQEIGLRMALGAQQADVLRSVLGQGLRPVAAGLAMGLALAVGAAVSIRSLLFGVEPLDPASLGGVACVLLLTAALACYLPARRAARIDPVTALRSE
jgi:predicted permease